MAKRFEKYGLWWPESQHPLALEIEMVTEGGRFKTSKGKTVGEGLSFHFKEAIKLIWPEVMFHNWNNLIIDNYLTHRTIVLIGPASSGKTHSAALCLLMDYYCFPTQTTGIVCSTTRDRLEDRIWGEIKKLHRLATSRYRWLPGHLIEGKQRIVTDDRNEAEEGRDFRNGLVGVPCKKGGEYVGLGDFIGIKNKRVVLVGDELHLLPKVFVTAISNLDKNPRLVVMGLGNPKETTDALGVLGEPAAHHGGWEGGIDQLPQTKIWETRRPQGVCVQLVGTDSPNLDGKLGIPLITQEQIDRDVAFYGRDSLWFTMMNQGMMPRGQGSRRVITRQACLKFGAMNAPHWSGEPLTRVAFLDAAYRGVGGDRCVFGELDFGDEVALGDKPDVSQSLINIHNPDTPKRKILALVDQMIIPITAGVSSDMPEDQIVRFVQEQCEKRNIPPRNFFFDSGSRTSLVSAFSRIWSTDVVPIDCGGKPSDRKVTHDIDIVCKDYYQKFVTELWYSVRLAIEAGQVRGLTEEVVWEGCTREWGMTTGNKIEVETKEDMKLKCGRSPDLFDALAIGVEGARRLGFVIQKLANDQRRRLNDRWKTELRKKANELFGSKSLNYAT
jgi:hypothetical protein